MSEKVTTKGHAVKDLVAAFEQGHTTKLTYEDRKYVVGWLRITRPYMQQIQIARLLGVGADVIRKDWAELDNEMSDSMQAIDVGILLAQLGAQANFAIEKIHAGLEAMEETDKGKQTATYLAFAKAPFEIYQNLLKTMKDIGLIGEDGSQVQEETRWTTITNKAGVTTTELTHRINQDIERAKRRAFEPGVFSAPKQLEGPEDATESQPSQTDNTIQ